MSSDNKNSLAPVGKNGDSPNTGENSTLSIAWQKGLAAARQNFYPALALWAFGIALIVSYFFLPAVHDWLDRVAQYKIQTGWIFAAISTAFFAGVVPFAIPYLFGSGVKKGLGYLMTNIFFWAYKGIEVDLFYVLQAKFFGNDASISTIVTKVVVDQLVYAPLLGLTTVVLFYLWRDNRYSGSAFKKELGSNWYRNKILPVLISNWFVWTPACVIVYLLPLGLQLPIQNLILCFWVLILTFFTEGNEEK